MSVKRCTCSSVSVMTSPSVLMGASPHLLVAEWEHAPAAAPRMTPERMSHPQPWAGHEMGRESRNGGCVPGLQAQLAKPRRGRWGWREATGGAGASTG